MGVLIILGIVAVIALFVVCCLIEEVKVIAQTTLCVAKLIVGLFVKGWGTCLFVYAILSALHWIILLGVDCFNSDTKGTWIPRNDGKGFKEDVNHPISAFIGTLLVIAFALLIEYGICYFFHFYTLLPIVSGIALILDIIALLSVFFWE